MSEFLFIRLKKSKFNRKPEHVATVKALGLHRLNSYVIKKATPQIRGMIKKIEYLLEVKDVNSS
jgi:large subunit ribosomal protein L30